MARNRGMANTRANELMGNFMEKMNTTGKSPVTLASNGNGDGDGDKKKKKSTSSSSVTSSNSSIEAQIGENKSTTSTVWNPKSDWMPDPDVENGQFRTQTGMTTNTTTEPGKILAERGTITKKFKGTDEEYLQKLVKGGNYSNVTPDEMVEKGIIGKGFADWWGGHGYQPKTTTTETPLNRRETRVTPTTTTIPKTKELPKTISTYAPLSDKRRGLRKTRLGNNRRISQPLTNIFGEKTYSIHSKNKKKQAAAVKHADHHDQKVQSWYDKNSPGAKSHGFQNSAFDTARAYESGQVDQHRLSIKEEHRGQLLSTTPTKRGAKKMEKSEKRWAMNKYNPNNRGLSRKEMKDAYKNNQV